MKEAEIYVYSAVNTVKHTNGFGGYLLAFKRENNCPYTVDRFCLLKDSTRQISEIMLISSALKHFKEKCSITVHVYNLHTRRAIDEWFDLWKEREWCDRNGKSLPEWYRICWELMAGHEVTVTPEKGEYTMWLKDNTDRKIREGEKGCLISLENLIQQKSSTEQPKA